MKLLLVATALLISQSSQAQSVPPINWNLIKTTEVKGETYETYQNQNGDQAIVKPRTEPSFRPDADPTPQNLNLRQSMIELGFGISMEHFSKESLNWKRNGVSGEFGQLYDGSPTTTTQNTNMQEAFVAFHPPVKGLTRFTLGGGYILGMFGGPNIRMTCPREKLTWENINDCGEVLSVENGWIPADNMRVTYPRGAGYGSQSTGQNWYIFTDYDIWYIPGKKTLHAISAGYNYGAQENNHKAEYDEYAGEVQKTHGIRVKYRLIRDSKYKVSASNIFVTGTFDTRGGYRITGGMALGLGTPIKMPKLIEK